MSKHKVLSQPPSGGCVLKPLYNDKGERKTNQPPSGGCVLKHFEFPLYK